MWSGTRRSIDFSVPLSPPRHITLSAATLKQDVVPIVHVVIMLASRLLGGKNVLIRRNFRAWKANNLLGIR